MENGRGAPEGFEAGRAGKRLPSFRDLSLEEKSMAQSSSSHLPDQPIMKYVHPTDRLRPWFGVAVGLAALVGMLAFGILGRHSTMRAVGLRCL